MARCFLLTTISCLLLSACSEPAKQDRSTSSGENAIIYGEDNRVEPYEYHDQAWAEHALSATVALIKKSRIDDSNPNDIKVTNSLLYDKYNFCADEAFASQNSVASCTGTLIAPDLVLTAGHCLGDDLGEEQQVCEGYSFVFGFSWKPSGQLRTISQDDVYDCQEVLVVKNPGLSVDRELLDYAVIQLDREVTQDKNVSPVFLERRTLKTSSPLVVAGHPYGIPIKLADGAKSFRNGEPDLISFDSNLDTFGGNSGSGVYVDSPNADKPVIGIHAIGLGYGTDWDSSNGCNRWGRVSETYIPGSSVYAFRAIEELCSVPLHSANYPQLCSCGDGICAPEFEETTTTCISDCGEHCGDGFCSDSENMDNCLDDCKHSTCGDGYCDPEETVKQNCCADCGCEIGFSCGNDYCYPDPTVIGDTCDAAITIDPHGTHYLYVKFEDMPVMNSHSASSCYSSSPDATEYVYTFTINEDTYIRADVQTVPKSPFTELDLSLLRLEKDSCGGTNVVNCAVESTYNSENSSISTVLTPGTYYLIVEAADQDSVDNSLAIVEFSDKVGLTVPSGETCSVRFPSHREFQ